MSAVPPPASPPLIQKKTSGRVAVFVLLTALVLVGYGLRVAIQMGQPELEEAAPEATE